MTTFQTGFPWYRKKRTLYAAAYFFGLAAAAVVFSTGLHFPVWLGRTCFFLIAPVFIAAGPLAAVFGSVESPAMILLTAAYFPLVLFAFGKLYESLARNHRAVLICTAVLLLSVHSLADRLILIYIGESIRNTAPDPEPSSAASDLTAIMSLEDEHEESAETVGVWPDELPPRAGNI